MSIPSYPHLVPLSFGNIFIRDMRRRAKKLEEIPDFEFKVKFGDPKLPDLATANVETKVGLTFHDRQPIDEKLHEYASRMLSASLGYEVFSFFTQDRNDVKVGDKIFSHTLEHSEMTRIFKLMVSEKMDHMPIIRYLDNGLPAISLGLGRGIVATMVPEDSNIKLQSTTPVWGFFSLLDIKEDEPTINGLIMIAGQKYRLFFWRTYNNRLFNYYASVSALIERLLQVLNDYKPLIDAIGGYGEIAISELYDPQQD